MRSVKDAVWELKRREVLEHTERNAWYVWWDEVTETAWLRDEQVRERYYAWVWRRLALPAIRHNWLMYFGIYLSIVTGTTLLMTIAGPWVALAAGSIGAAWLGVSWRAVPPRRTREALARAHLPGACKDEFFTRYGNDLPGTVLGDWETSERLLAGLSQLQRGIIITLAPTWPGTVSELVDLACEDLGPTGRKDNWPDGCAA